MAATVITKENLAAFQRWLLELKPRSDISTYDIARDLYFELPLGVILKDAPTLSPIAQKVIANVITLNHIKDPYADVETLLDMAEKQPIMLGKTFVTSGNSGSGYIYSLLLAAMEKRPFEKNIPAIYAMLHFAPVYGHDVGTGDIEKTSVKNAKMLNEIFEKSYSHSSNDQFRASAYEFINSLDMSRLLNFEGASPEFRKRINAATFNNWHNDKYEQIAKMNPQLIDEQILANFMAAIKPHTDNDTSNAKTQAEKNANILPAWYTKLRDTLIRMVERQEIHDRNNYGKLKTLTQRFNDLKARMQKDKTWPTDNQRFGALVELVQDVYLKMIQRDIIDGRAADLSKEELALALQNDKDGFYIRLVPKELVAGLNLKGNGWQQLISMTRDPHNTNYIVQHTKLPARDKRAMIDKLEQIVTDEEDTRKKLSAELEKYNKDYQDAESINVDSANTYKIYNDMEYIQSAYKRIRANFKDGAPNAQEAHLTLSEMERAIYSYLTGASDKKIDIPAQKSLPIFGRAKEKERRENLEREIREFNKLLTSVREKTTNALLEMWSQYRGAILNPDSLQAANQKNEDSRRKRNYTYELLERTHRKKDTIESDLRKYTAKKESLDRAKADFDAKQKKMHDLAQRHMGRNQTGALTPVTDNMSPEEKRATRQKNKAVLTDVLATRRDKKPAKNLAEMLANADMER